MKNVLVSCSALALLLLSACGGDAASAAPGSNAPAVNPPAQAPAPAAAPQPAAGSPAVETPQAPAAAPAPTAGAQDPGKKPIPRPRIDYETMKRLFGNDPPADEVDNPPTPEKIALGKALYHAPLGAGGTSCATCHPLDTYGADGKPVPAGGKRNAPTTWNAFRQFRQGWDGAAATVEELSLAHALGPTGLGVGDEAKLVAGLAGKPELVAAFTAAFPGGEAVTPANFKLAVGAFLRTLQTKSRWDAWLGGDQKALANEELLGLKTFVDVGCTTCHLTRLVGGHMFQKTGLLKQYSSTDTGRMQLSKSDADKFFFKVPSLLNVEKTGPWLHDGKVTTLEQVVTTMADIQLDKKLTPEQHAAIVAFLKALTGPLPTTGAGGK